MGGKSEGSCMLPSRGDSHPTGESSVLRCGPLPFPEPAAVSPTQQIARGHGADRLR